jgi:hypothetical protein
MSMHTIPCRKQVANVLAAFAAMAILLLQAPDLAAADDDETVTQATLLDRIQIEDLLVKYYADLGSGKGHNLAQFFTEDAVLDVNGDISEGRKAIEAMYGRVGTGQDAAPRGRMHMLLSNPVISVKGNTAKARLIWTGVMNDDVKKPPRLLEQGREYTELVKLNGRWYIKKRYITADSGMPEIWDKTYKPREF